MTNDYRSPCDTCPWMVRIDAGHAYCPSANGTCLRTYEQKDDNGDDLNEEA